MFPAPCLGQRLAGVPGSSQLHPRVAVGSGDHPFILTSKGRVDVDGYLSLCSFMRGGGGFLSLLLSTGCLAGRFGVIADLLPWGCGLWLAWTSLLHWGSTDCTQAPSSDCAGMAGLCQGQLPSACCLVPLVL